VNLSVSSVSAIANLTSAILGIYFALASGELLWRYEALDAGLLSWRYGRLRHKWCVRGRIGKWLDYILEYPTVIKLIALRLGLSLLLILSAVIVVPQSLRAAAIIVIAILSLALSFRHAHGGDGADQFALISIVSLSLGQVSNKATAIALMFIVFQLLLAYTVAGSAKLVSQKWRDGSGLLKLVQTRAYGAEWLATLFRRYQHLPRFMSWVVIMAQLAMVPLFVAGFPYLLLAIAIGIIFHLSMAIVMRLHTFLWAFLSAYPALIWARMVLTGHVR
jgi:hypothetical protein